MAGSLFPLVATSLLLVVARLLPLVVAVFLVSAWFLIVLYWPRCHLCRRRSFGGGIAVRLCGNDFGGCVFPHCGDIAVPCVAVGPCAGIAASCGGIFAARGGIVGPCGGIRAPVGASLVVVMVVSLMLVVAL